MRIFIDVGAHYGETLQVALDPKWGFARIYALEPASLCLNVLRTFRDQRVIVEPIGLSNRNGAARLHAAGSLGGSLYSDKQQAAPGQVTEKIKLVRATDWFRRTLPPEADVYLKMNCEGGEADILEDLLNSGEIAKVKNLYVDFDIRKVPSQAHRQNGIEKRLQSAGVRYLSTDAIGNAGNPAVLEWLEQCCTPVVAPVRARLRHALLADLPTYERTKRIAAAILPRKLYWTVARRFGRLARRGAR